MESTFFHMARSHANALGLCPEACALQVYKLALIASLQAVRLIGFCGPYAVNMTANVQACSKNHVWVGSVCLGALQCFARLGNMRNH